MNYTIMFSGTCCASIFSECLFPRASQSCLCMAILSPGVAARVPYCTKQHQMPLVPYSPGDHNPKGYTTGWICDICGMRSKIEGPPFSTKRYHCSPCHADICTRCFTPRSAGAGRRNRRTCVWCVGGGRQTDRACGFLPIFCVDTRRGTRS